jgi:N-acetylneuraminate synthase
MDKEDLKHFHSRMNRTVELLGGFELTAIDDEAPARANARRSLVAAKAMPAGHVVTFDDLTWKRPASGISPKDISQLIGKQTAQDIAEDDVLRWNMFS